jgi:hypothetical protein
MDRYLSKDVPLMLSQSSLASDLEAVFTDISGGTAKKKADLMAAAIYSYVTSGVPMCILVTLPGLPGAIMGTGIGGIDKPVGAGLVMPTLLQGLISTFKAMGDAASSAKGFATAIHSYFSVAMVMTVDSNGTVPTITGMGGIGKPVPGMGYAAAKSLLAKDLEEIYSDVAPGGTVEGKAQKIATAIDKFCQQGIVKTKGNFAAPPILPPPTFGPGAGVSKGELL